MRGQFVGAVLMVALSSSAGIANENSIVGTWKIQSLVREVSATGERQNELGEKPSGYISYQPDGRMFVVLVGDNRAKPAASAPDGRRKG
jgi:Lipocalin-like domain